MLDPYSRNGLAESSFAQCSKSGRSDRRCDLRLDRGAFRLTYLQTLLPSDLGLPPVKHRQFVNEAKALDYAELMKLKLIANRPMIGLVCMRKAAISSLSPNCTISGFRPGT